MQVATLAKRGQIPVGAVGFVSVQVVNRENMSCVDVVRVIAPFASPVSCGLDGPGDVLPIVGIREFGSGHGVGKLLVWSESVIRHS